ncbi:NAD-dependent epimerase [Georgenia halophila]
MTSPPRGPGWSYQHWERQWPPLAASLLRAAEDTGAVLTVMGNLYGYGPVDGQITRDLPLSAPGHMGRLRARMWQEALAAHQAGRIRATEVRASDYMGVLSPWNGMLVLYADSARRGRPVFSFGDPDVPHSFSYVPDVAATLAAVATDERAWGQAWHVPSPPAVTVRSALTDVAEVAGARRPRIVRIPRGLLRLSYPFVPLMRELDELLYQWDRPYVLDASETTQTFGIEATPWGEVVERTVGGLERAGKRAATPALFPSPGDHPRPARYAQLWAVGLPYVI